MTAMYVGLAILRKGKGWTIDELAARADVSRATIIRLEQRQTERIDFRTLDRLADALGVEPGSLIQRER